MEPNQLQVLWPDNSGDSITFDFQRIDEKIIRVYSDPMPSGRTQPRTYIIKFMGLGLDKSDAPDSEVTFIIKQEVNNTISITEA